MCFKIKKNAKLFNGRIETAEAEFEMHLHDLLAIAECECGALDCSGRAYVFSDGFGGNFWVHDSDVVPLGKERAA